MSDHATLQRMIEARDEAIHEQSAALAKAESRVYFLEDNMACIADIVNRMCREYSVEECKTPFADLAIRETIDRLWGKISEEFAKASEQ